MSTLISFDTTPNSYGVSVSYGSLNSSFYTSNGLSASIWNLSTPIPSLNPKDYTLLIFDSIPNNHGVTVQDSALNESFFTTNGLSSAIWFLNTTRPTLRPKDYTLLIFNVVPNNYSVNITDTNARKQSSYPSFNFDTPWAIVEDVTYPYFLRADGESINDPALTSRKIYVFVEENIDGSLFYAGKVWKSLKRTISFDSIVGEVNGTVTHHYGGANLKDNLDEPYLFMVSAIQDPARPGGYGFLETTTNRTVTLLSDRSNNVAFYYAQSIPTYDYLMRIQSSDLLFHIALFDSNASDIRVVMTDGVVARIGLVTLEDPSASPIRVMTNEGIFALQDASGFAGGGGPFTEIPSEYVEPTQPMGNIAPTYNLNVSASSVFGGGYEASNVYDGNASTLWYANGVEAYLLTELNSALIVNTVRLLCADGRARLFSVNGSNDNSTWVTLGSYTRAGNTIWQEFNVANQTAYKFYRITFTGSLYSGSNVSITELELIYN
jgi:hypothetical protein